eukprot:1246221-Prorocentrum_lima.AAC.1
MLPVRALQQSPAPPLVEEERRRLGELVQGPVRAVAVAAPLLLLLAALVPRTVAAVALVAVLGSVL